jgi:FlaA1/EpsC-like NDP-sugar epimerase
MTLDELEKFIHSGEATIKGESDVVDQASLDMRMVDVFAGDIKGKLPRRETSVVLITGATGGLGATIVRELLLQAKIEVWCLIRGSTLQARRRLLEAVAHSRGGNVLGKAEEERLRVYSGDVEKVGCSL